MSEATAPSTAGEGTSAARVLPLRLPAALVAAVASGVLYWAAFPGVDVWPLTLVAFVPVMIAMQGQSVGRSTLLGAVAGATMNLCGFYWLVGMLQTFSGFPVPVCFLFVLIVCIYQGGRIGLLGWLYARASQRGWPGPLTFAGAFVASELAYPLLFPWYYSATVHQAHALTQLADVGGPIGVGLVLVAANVAVAEVVLARLERRSLRRPTVVTGVVVLSLASLYGVLRIRAVDATMRAAPQSTVGVVQADMGLMEKRTQFSEGLRRHMTMSASLRERGADFLVWSETSAMRPVANDTYQDDLRPLAHAIGRPTVFGAVILERVRDEREYVVFNTAVSSNADGDIRGRYDKQYLLMFGEYLPFGDTFPILHKWSPNSGHFTPGTSLDPLPLNVGGAEHVASPLVCYEDVLPRFTNDAVRHANPDLLVNITNDAWFGDTAEPWQHLGLAQSRAIEHRRYLVRGTNSGVSAVIDPVGRVVAHTKTFQQDTILTPIHWMREHTVYEVVGDMPWLLVTLWMAFAAFRRVPAAVGMPRPNATA